MTRDVQPLRDALAGRYRIEREIGRGAMATVYRAEPVDGEGTVAIKVLRPELVIALGADRFHREVEILGRLRHPGIVPVLDSGEVGRLLYLVMPYVPGENLRACLEREGPLPLPLALSIVAEVTAALDYAHHERIVHRNIRPENLLLNGAWPLICDFGLARAIDRAALEPLSSSGLVIGTSAYMSPEQAMGPEPIGTASDIYSLGCVVFEMPIGQMPFPGPTQQAVIARHLTEAPRSKRTVRPDLPKSVERAVAAALAKSPHDRPASGAELPRRLSP